MKKSVVWAVSTTVVALGLLIAGGLYILYARTCNVTLVRSQLFSLQVKLETFQLDKGQFPVALDDLLKSDPDGLGPYAKTHELSDPWKSDFYYRLSPDGRGFLLFTLGRDKRLGGSGNDADVQIEFAGSGQRTR